MSRCGGLSERVDIVMSDSGMLCIEYKFGEDGFLKFTLDPTDDDDDDD